MKQIYDSWNENADEWIRVMECAAISSRKITNPAIVDAVLNVDCHKILDAGCGEGWLCRELVQKGKNVTGIDANNKLLEYALSKGGASFVRLSFEEIIAHTPLPDAPYNCIVFNFSLYLDLDTLLLLQKVKKNGLTPDGTIIIQTIHPLFITQNQLPYKSQWIDDSWKGLPGEFRNGHPYYIRTFSGWLQTIAKAGLDLKNIIEPLNDNGIPVSLILELSHA